MSTNDSTDDSTDVTTDVSTGETGITTTDDVMGTARTLQQFPEKLAVVRLPKGAEIPTWAESSSLFSITATALETSLVCAGRDVPTKVVAQRGLIGFALESPADDTLDPTSAGVLVSLLAPLAEAGIGVQVISTYQTVWVLVPSPDVERAAEEWRRRGHVVHLAVPVQPSRKPKKR